MPPSPANTLDPSRSSRQQQHAAELYAPFSPTSMPSGSAMHFNMEHKREQSAGEGVFFFDVNSGALR